jgi:predicted nucleic acid-binding protein
VIYLADTNVLLRVVHRADPRHDLARVALRRLQAEGHKVQAAEQNFIEFWNVTTRPRAQNGFGVDPAEAKRFLNLVERIFPRLPRSTEIYPEWCRLVTTFAVSGVQVHDAHLAATMLVNGITHILTLNTKDFRRYGSEGIVAVNPRDL